MDIERELIFQKKHPKLGFYTFKIVISNHYFIDREQHKKLKISKERKITGLTIQNIKTIVEKKLFNMMNKEEKYTFTFESEKGYKNHILLAFEKSGIKNIDYKIVIISALQSKYSTIKYKKVDLFNRFFDSTITLESLIRSNQTSNIKKVCSLKDSNNISKMKPVKLKIKNPIIKPLKKFKIKKKGIQKELLKSSKLELDSNLNISKNIKNDDITNKRSVSKNDMLNNKVKGLEGRLRKQKIYFQYEEEITPEYLKYLKELFMRNIEKYSTGSKDSFFATYINALEIFQRLEPRYKYPDSNNDYFYSKPEIENNLENKIA